MRLSYRIFLFWALIAAAGLGASLVTRAQPATATPDVLPALLTEVRALRVAMEQMASAGPRVQLALGRLQLQEQRVNDLGRRLEIAKVNQGPPQREYDRLSVRIKELTEALPGLNDSGRRETEEMLRDMKREHARLGTELQKLIAEEGLLNQEIANEQTRWTDLNQRMEELERSLTRR